MAWGAEELIAGDRHFSGISTRILVDHVRDHLGPDGVERLRATAGEDRPCEVLLDDTSWSSYHQFRALLEAAGELLAGHGGLGAIGEVDHVARTSAPDFAQAMQAFGSPVELARAMDHTGASFFPVLDVIDLEDAGPTFLRTRHRLAEGFDPFPELCLFLRGLRAQIIRMFGLRIIRSEETSCQCHGDEVCVNVLEWDATDDAAAQLRATRTSLALAESRLQAFQEAVDDIVSTDHLDTVLARIVHHAARAFPAPGYVLVVDGLAGARQVYTDGVSVEEAEAYLQARDSASSPPAVTVEVASSRRRYGRLSMLPPISAASYERSNLEAYARLAATALDSSTALDEARRQAHSAEALLKLSTALAEVSSTEELAAEVARAMPEVIDCDCAMVMFVADGMARVAAHHGYPPEMAAQLDGMEVPSGYDGRGFSRHTRDAMASPGQELMDAAGLEAVASAPLRSGDTTFGILIASVRHDSGRILDDAKLGERFAGLAGQASVALRNRQLLDEIRHRSLHDPLTELANRVLIMDRAEHMIARARRHGTPLAALFIDLDGFKQVNDLHGHAAGDQLLGQVAGRLRGALRGEDTVGRLGGDEFVVLVEGAALDAGVDAVAERLIDVLCQPFQLADGDTVTIGASIGVAVGVRSCADDLLRDADAALYQAKSSGRSCHRCFEPGMTPGSTGPVALLAALADS